MIAHIATAAGENLGHHVEKSLDSLKSRITAIFDCVLQKLQAAGRRDLVIVEKASKPVQIIWSV